jgi:hypothetical protein
MRVLGGGEKIVLGLPGVQAVKRVANIAATAKTISRWKINPLRSGFPEGGGLKIKRRARSLSDGALDPGLFAAGAADEAAAGRFAALAVLLGAF